MSKERVGYAFIPLPEDMAGPWRTRSFYDQAVATRMFAAFKESWISVSPDDLPEVACRECCIPGRERPNFKRAIKRLLAAGLIVSSEGRCILLYRDEVYREHHHLGGAKDPVTSPADAQHVDSCSTADRIQVPTSSTPALHPSGPKSTESFGSKSQREEREEKREERGARAPEDFGLEELVTLFSDLRKAATGASYGKHPNRTHYELFCQALDWARTEAEETGRDPRDLCAESISAWIAGADEFTRERKFTPALWAKDPGCWLITPAEAEPEDDDPCMVNGRFDAREHNRRLREMA